MKFLRSLDPNERMYWFGMVLLFIGLAFGVSVATALMVTGGVIVFISILNSLVIAVISKDLK
jgi:hypothetical protein